MEMKADVSRLPGELAKIPSVSTQLKMDEISTISKAAHKETAPVIVNSSGSSDGGGGGGGNRTGSVITHTPEVISTITSAAAVVGGGGVGGGASTGTISSVISDGLKQPLSTQRSSSPRHRKTAEEKVTVVAGNAVATATPSQTAAPVAYATATPSGTIQLPAGSLLQMPEGIMVYQGVQSSNSTSGVQKTATIVQQAATGTQSSNNQAQTYAIGVPTYVDGGGGAAVYLQGQTVQLVQVSGGQQVVYWPSVVQGGQATGTTTQARAQIAVLSTDANGAPVITID